MFSTLPGAEAEVQAIHHLFGQGRAELFIGIQADSFRMEAWHPSFTVLHLATHAVACQQDPLESFLLTTGLDSKEMSLDSAVWQVSNKADSRYPVTLEDWNPIQVANPRLLAADGSLPARRIMNRFQLTGMDLVTLSACQTGLGKLLGQGMIGFTRVFWAAGARSLLASLWRVDDDATRELMVDFYKEYLRHGNKAFALQQAMKSTRRKFPHPRYWAAFGLYGMAE